MQRLWVRRGKEILCPDWRKLSKSIKAYGYPSLDYWATV